MNKHQHNDRVSKDALFSVIATESQGLHKQLLTIAGVFLGGTIVFLEKIAPNPTPYTLVILVAGWVLLIVSMGLSCFVRLGNLEAGKYALEEKYETAAEIDRKKEGMSKAAVWCLVIGILCITCFGAVNLFCSL